LGPPAPIAASLTGTEGGKSFTGVVSLSLKSLAAAAATMPAVP
jgi:hypothetical protein